MTLFDPLDRFFARRLHINWNNTNDRNSYLLVIEIFWASILSSAAGFNAAFAIHLGAQNFEIGLLTSIPSLIVVLSSIPIGRFLERRAHRTPWVWSSLFLGRVGYLMIALLPWVKLPFLNQGQLLVALLIALTLPSNMFGIGWTPLLADVVPEERRAAVFAARNTISSLTASVMGFAFGQWLSRYAFPANYQWMYALGFVTSLLSTYNVMRMHVPDSVVAPIANAPKRIALTPREIWAKVQEMAELHPRFFAINRNTLLHGIGIWMASPLYILFFVRELGASDAWLGLNGTIGSIATILGYTLWRWLMARWGEPKTLRHTIILLGLYPFAVGMLGRLPAGFVLPLVLVAGAVNGLIVPGVSLSHFNTYLKAMPPESRASYNAIYTTIMNIGAFICPIISVTIANQIGLSNMLIIAGLLSVVGSSSFWWWPVVVEEKARTD